MRHSVQTVFVGKPVALLGRAPRKYREDDNLGTQFPQTLTSSGSNNQKGAYVEISSALSFEIDGFFIYLMPQSGTVSYAVDIALGAAGSEVVVLSNVLCGGCNSGFADSREVYVPLWLKAGARMSARVQASTANSSLSLGIRWVAAEWARAIRCKRATTYGANVSGTTAGTQVDPGAVANTLGAWAQITAALTNPIRGQAIMCLNNIGNTSRGDGSFGVDFGLGGAGSEVAMPARVPFQSAAFNDYLYDPLRNLSMVAPAGARLSARGASQITDATDRLFQLAIIGFD